MSQRSSRRFEHDSLAPVRRIHPLIVLVVLCALLFLPLVATSITPARAESFITQTTYTVTKTADTADGACNSDCSLREAVLAANAAPGADAIIVPAGLYVLTRAGTDEDAALFGDLDLTGTLTITGTSKGSTIVDGNVIDRVFHILAGATATISNVTIQDGILADIGGGILNEGTLTLDDTTITTNFATSGSAGGGIANRGVLKVNRSTFDNNNSTFGGAIFNEASGNAVTLNDSVLISNHASNGGGIFNKNGTIGITGTLILSNTATTGGGGIDNSSGATTTLFGSTVRENTAGSVGGGIFVEHGQVTVNAGAIISNTVYGLNPALGGGIYNWFGLILSDSTISGNSAYADNTCVSGGGCSTSYTSAGGGIYNNGAVTVVNSTLNLNSAWYRSSAGTHSAGAGAGLYNLSSSAQLENTIVANSRGYNGAETGNCTGSPLGITSNGHNLDSGYTCGMNNASDKVSIDPLLGPLKTFGSAPPLHPLQSGSQAIDGGDNNGCPALDQRGFPRPFDGDANGTATCDIGAYEFGFRLSLPLVIR